MNKKDAISIAFEEVLNHTNVCRALKGLKTTKEELILLISQHSYSLKTLGVSPSTQVKYIKLLAPDKPRNYKLCSYLLKEKNWKYCTKCRSVLDVSEFHVNGARHDGLNTHCKYCHYKDLVLYQPHVSAKRRAALLNAIPSWADLEAIAHIYSNCPKGYHVDHEVPLQGKNVCGLHVEYNLQYLPALENLKKGNKLLHLR